METVKNIWGKVTGAYSDFGSKGKATKVAMIVGPVIAGLIVISLVTGIFT